MKKILCPTDLSASAQNGTAYAAKLAHEMGAHLTLYHVLPLTEKLPFELLGGPSLTDEYERLLEEESVTISRTFKISCNGEVQTGSSSLAKMIAHKANTFDLLVMGTNGADDFYQFLTGSHAYRAVQKTNVPALVVPPGCLYSEIKSVVYAFDYVRERELPIQQLAPILAAFKAKLTVLQILEESYSADMEENLHDMQYILTERYGETIALTFDTVHAASIPVTINEYINNLQPDALAMCSVHRNFIERLFHKSAFKNISSVLTYPMIVFHQ